MTCDCCNEPLRRTSGYLLSTTSVVLSVPHWEARFALVKAMVEPLGPDERQLLGIFDSTLHSTAESATPWLVCEDCVALFLVDREAARTCAQRGVDPPGTGPVAPGACAQYAAIAWEIVFGRWPATVQQPEAADRCDFCGRRIYRDEPSGDVKRHTVDRLRGTDFAPLGSIRPDRDGWVSCMGCATGMVESLRVAGG